MKSSTVLERLRARGGIAVVFGSGLSAAAFPGRLIGEASYGEIPGMPLPSVAGHPGRLIAVDTGGARLFLLCGRRHLYEGGGLREAGGAAELAARLGCDRLLLTHAAGSLRRSLRVGSWLLASDIASFPCRALGGAGGRADRRVRPAASLLDRSLRLEAAAAAASAGVPVGDGVLFWTAGPAYETPAEAEAAARAGCDAATMSPLPELLAARRAGMRAACLAWITNYAPNVLRRQIGHDEVVAAGARGSADLVRIISALVRNE